MVVWSHHFYATSPLKVVKEEKPIGCGNERLNNPQSRHLEANSLQSLQRLRCRVVPANKEGLDDKQHAPSCAEPKSKHQYVGSVDQLNALHFGGKTLSIFYQRLNSAAGYRRACGLPTNVQNITLMLR